jgi:hypothetical protein
MLSDGRFGESVEGASKKADERSSNSPEKTARHRPRELKSAAAAAETGGNTSDASLGWRE